MNRNGDVAGRNRSSRYTQRHSIINTRGHRPHNSGTKIYIGYSRIGVSEIGWLTERN